MVGERRERAQRWDDVFYWISSFKVAGLLVVRMPSRSNRYYDVAENGKPDGTEPRCCALQTDMEHSNSKLGVMTPLKRTLGIWLFYYTSL